MTLKEQFKIGINFPTKATLNNCEQVADEFAIGFLWWVSNGDHEYTVEWNNGYHTTKELLEIYKKIRGL